MLIKRLMEFREKTLEIYNKDHQQEMEPWKLEVLKLHEEACFLFYFDEFLEWDERTGSAVMKGNLIKGDVKAGSIIYLYDGEARLLSEAQVCSSPEEKEDKRIGMLREKKNIFEIKVLPHMEWREMERKLRNLQMELSLVSDYPPSKRKML